MPALLLRLFQRSLLGLALGLVSAPLIGASLPPSDRRLAPPRDLNTKRTFPELGDRAAWEARARVIRGQVLVACGLWPEPERTPLQARVFGRIERDGYSIEKVQFQTLPGFYLAGNLYRPAGPRSGRVPGILNPHGHWSNGRMADQPDGSIAARCISFARQGMVAFSYDMVGYNDTVQVSHKFAAAPTNQLWSISLMGLQTWNSVRALDFLSSLPDVDPARLACTGESGGGTQTFMLGAIDDRLAVQAPIVMVSHSMQGGCLCENAPGLRVDYSNMEIAAVPAPRPQILVAATGDWTRDTLKIEGPALESVYRLFQATDRLRYVLFDYGHNYNQTSREAVYEFFGRWLLRHPNPASLKEAPYRKEPDADLRVFPDGKLPADALNEAALIQAWIARSQAQWRAALPASRDDLARYRDRYGAVWARSLQLPAEGYDLLVEKGPAQTHGGLTVARVAFGEASRGDRIPGFWFEPVQARPGAVVLVHPDGKAAFLTADGGQTGLAKRLLDQGHRVLVFDTFLTGELASPTIAAARNPFANYFTTHNRTDVQERVRDIMAACSFVRSRLGGGRIALVGVGRAGLWTLLAAPGAEVVVADCQGFDTTSDQALLASDLFTPGFRRFGGFEGAALLAAPHPLLLHHTGAQFATDTLSATYARLGARQACRVEAQPWAEERIAAWVNSQL